MKILDLSQCKLLPLHRARWVLRPQIKTLLQYTFSQHLSEAWTWVVSSSTSQKYSSLKLDNEVNDQRFWSGSVSVCRVRYRLIPHFEKFETMSNGKIR